MKTMSIATALLGLTALCMTAVSLPAGADPQPDCVAMQAAGVVPPGQAWVQYGPGSSSGYYSAREYIPGPNPQWAIETYPCSLMVDTLMCAALRDRGLPLPPPCSNPAVNIDDLYYTADGLVSQMDPPEVTSACMFLHQRLGPGPWSCQ